MRLIDSDALKESLKESAVRCKKWMSDCAEAKDDVMRGRAEQALLTFNECIMRINAQPTITQNPDEWCVDCKEYDSEKHCCPRFNHVIRKAMERKKGKSKRIHELETELRDYKNKGDDD